MSVPVSSPLRRYRRRILGLGLLGVAVLCGVGGAAVPPQRRERPRAARAVRAGGARLRRRVGRVLGAGRRAAVCRTAGRAGGRDRRRHRRVGCAGDRARPLVSRRRFDPTAPTTGRPRRRRPTTTRSTSSVDARRRRRRPRRAADDAPDFDSIVDVVTSGPQFSILASLIDEADVAEMLAGIGSVHAVRAVRRRVRALLAADTLAELRQDPERLGALLRHHVVGRRRTRPSELEPGALEMLDGTTLSVTVADGEITIGGAAITSPISSPPTVWCTSSTGSCCPRRPTEPDDRVPTVSATLAAGQVVLDGDGRRRDPTRRARRRRVAGPRPGQHRRPAHDRAGRGDRRRHGALRWPSSWPRCRRTS